jgi:outer membrane protein assembly factor BamB
VSPAGAEEWRFRTVDHLVNGSPAVAADGTIFAVSWDTKLHALAPDGSEQWSFSFPTHKPLDSSVLLGPDGTLYVGCWDDTLYALQPRAEVALAAGAWPLEGRDLRHTGAASAATPD